MSVPMSDEKGTFRILELTDLVQAMVAGNSLKSFGDYQHVATVSAPIFEKYREIEFDSNDGSLTWVKVISDGVDGVLEVSMELDIMVSVNQVLLFDERGMATLQKHGTNALKHMNITRL